MRYSFQVYYLLEHIQMICKRTFTSNPYRKQLEQYSWLIYIEGISQKRNIETLKHSELIYTKIQLSKKYIQNIPFKSAYLVEE